MHPRTKPGKISALLSCLEKTRIALQFFRYPLTSDMFKLLSRFHPALFYILRMTLIPYI